MKTSMLKSFALMLALLMLTVFAAAFAEEVSPVEIPAEDEYAEAEEEVRLLQPVEGQQLYTLTTREGATYYLLMDAEGGSEVLLLRPVSERDLVALALPDETEQEPAEEKADLLAPVVSLAEKDEVPAPEHHAEPTETPRANRSFLDALIFVLCLIILAVVGVQVYSSRDVKEKVVGFWQGLRTRRDKKAEADTADEHPAEENGSAEAEKTEAEPAGADEEAITEPVSEQVMEEADNDDDEDDGVVRIVRNL